MPRLADTAPGTSLAWEAVGEGVPLIALHGAYSARTEVSGFLEPLLADRALRRVYVDLPGHRESVPSEGLRTVDDALDLFDRMLEIEAPDGPFLLFGHSYGAHVARAIAARHPDRVAGLALVCAFVPGSSDPAVAEVVRDDGVGATLDDEARAAFEGYFVVRTADTLERFRTVVAPATSEVDDDAFAWGDDTTTPHRDPDTVPLACPVLVLSGRRDGWVGWRAQERMAESYPDARVVTLDDAGHALPHERPEEFARLLGDWIDRAVRRISVEV